MRNLLLAVAAAGLFALPLPATAGSAVPSTDISSQSVRIGPGGVRVHGRFESRERRERRSERRCVTERTTRTTPSGRVIRETRKVCR